MSYIPPLDANQPQHAGAQPTYAPSGYPQSRQDSQNVGYSPQQSYATGPGYTSASMGMPVLGMDGSHTPYGVPVHSAQPVAPWDVPPHVHSPQTRYETPPLPPPTPKVAYAPPVFQTFQDRKRAQELALMAQRQAQEQAEAEAQQKAQRIVQAQAQAQMERQRPLPSPSSSSSSITRVLPVAPGAGGMRASPLMSGSSSPGIPGSPLASHNLPYTAPLPPPRSTSPLPPPRPASPQPPPRSASTEIPLRASASFSSIGSQPHRVPSPLPQPPRSHTLPPSSPAPLGRPLPVPIPRQAAIERSDTISSVRSLDLERQRPLPRPPVGVNTSKSLDRGISPVPSGSGRTSRPVSVISEEMEDLGRRLGSMGARTPSPIPQPPSSVSFAPTLPPQSIGGVRTPSPAPPAQPSPSLPLAPKMEEPRRREPGAPAKFQPLPPPTIALPDGESSSDESEPVVRSSRSRSSSPGPAVSITGPPIIAVSTGDTRDTLTGDISFTVPTFSFDVDEPEPTQSSSTAQASAPVIQLPTLATEPATASSSRPRQIQTSGSAILCAHCHEPIVGPIVNAMGKRWHPGCFMCAECGELLEHVSSYESDGKAYCHLDYHNKHAHTCFHCKTAIVDSRFVTLDLPELGRRYYHELHFFCGECGDPFLDPSKSSAPGTKRARQQATKDESEDEDETNNFVFHKGHPFCERCHLRLHKPKCQACRQPIPEIAISAMGAKWHKECFVCTNCHNEFANGLFFPKDGGAFCTTCYEQLLGQ